MSWKICDMKEARRNFIEDVGRESVCFAEVCRRHGISESCGYKWKNRHKQQGQRGLEELSRRPHHSPLRTSSEMESKVVAVRLEHPVWGGRKIARVLQNSGEKDVPAASTITGILRRHGLLGEGTRGASPDMQRFERSEPNDLWQMDFKGWIRTSDQRRCYPLTVLDDHSRYNIVLEACAAENRIEVQKRLEAAFARVGLPRQILCDHGNPWGGGLKNQGRKGTPGIEIWLNRLGVELIHGRVRHPQTQGKEERFHRTLKAEVLERELKWRDLEHCQEAFERWRTIYNCKRPHEALGLDTPDSRYRLSGRSLPKSLPSPESFYLEGDQIRRVKTKGEITFQNRFFTIGTAYRGQPVALRPRGEQRWEVYHCWRSLGKIDFGDEAKKKGSYHPLKKDYEEP